MNGSAKSFEFDAFVSYCDADEEWTLSELIAPMRSAGLRIIHKGDFEPGIPKIDAHSDAVVRSRKSIIVMSPAWCESEWENLDSVIAQTPNPGGFCVALIPLIVQPCTLPPRIDRRSSRPTLPTRPYARRRSTASSGTSVVRHRRSTRPARGPSGKGSPRWRSCSGPEGPGPPRAPTRNPSRKPQA